MTLIIGARCADGILLAADRKVIRGGESDYMDKVFGVEGAVLAFEGLTGIRDDFLLLLRSEIDSRARRFTSLYEMKLVVEDIVADLSGRYCERLGGEGTLGALLGGLTTISEGTAEIYYVHPQGYGESVRYRCSGHGADYAHSLAKFLLNQRDSVEDNAYRAAFVISWVSEDIDTFVGGVPQVAMIKDNTPGVNYLSAELTERAAQRAKILRPRLARALRLT